METLEKRNNQKVIANSSKQVVFSFPAYLNTQIMIQYN